MDRSSHLKGHFCWFALPGHLYPFWFSESTDVTFIDSWVEPNSHKNYQGEKFTLKNQAIFSLTCTYPALGSIAARCICYWGWSFNTESKSLKKKILARKWSTISDRVMSHSQTPILKMTNPKAVFLSLLIHLTKYPLAISCLLGTCCYWRCRDERHGHPWGALCWRQHIKAKNTAHSFILAVMGSSASSLKESIPRKNLFPGIWRVSRSHRDLI